MEKVLKKVLKRVRPGAREKREMDAFSRAVIRAAKEARARPMLCGSVQKNTWLSGRNELDLFLLFSPRVSRANLEKRGLSAARRIIRKMKGTFVIAYSEHPYLRGKIRFRGRVYDVDIVPAYDIKDAGRIKSAVDRTPHHVKYIMKNMKKKQQDDTRLLKQFCKAAKCYGADLKVQGFSGYLCELLILHYGSFPRCVREARKWQAGIRIGKGEVRFRSPLTVIDPVDPKRNVAAAVSPESFYKFVKACKDFVNRPNERMFLAGREGSYSAAEVAREMKSRQTRLYILRFSKPEGLEDTTWSQMRRALKRLTAILEKGGFKVLGSGSYLDDSGIIFLELEVWRVPRTYKHPGPNIYDHKQSKGFLRRYKGKNVFIEGENWIVEQKREHVLALYYLREFFSQPVRELQEQGIPRRLAEVMHRSRIVSGSDAIKLLDRMPELRLVLKEYFEKDLNII